MPSALALSSLIGAAAVVVWRLRETKGPVSVKKIVIPPLGMATGFSMFIAPATRIPVLWGVCAFFLGLLVFSYPLIKTSKLIRRGNEVILERSRAFLFIILGLVVVRLALRTYVEQYVDPVQTGSLFFVLAFGMIVRWRVGMYLEYKELMRQ